MITLPGHSVYDDVQILVRWLREMDDIEVLEVRDGASIQLRYFGPYMLFRESDLEDLTDESWYLQVAVREIDENVTALNISTHVLSMSAVTGDEATMADLLSRNASNFLGFFALDEERNAVLLECAIVCSMASPGRLNQMIGMLALQASITADWYCELHGIQPTYGLFGEAD